MTDAPSPNVCFLRHVAADVAIQSLEQLLADDGFFRLMDDEPDALASDGRAFHVAQVNGAWTAVWDEWGSPGEGFPDGDPATALARGLSAWADTDVLQLWSHWPLWGYFIFRRGTTVDRFASDTRLFRATFAVDDDVLGDAAGTAYRGDLDRLAALAPRPVPEEALASALGPGEDSLMDLLKHVGLPGGVALSYEALSPSERELTARLRFAPRV